MTPPQPLRRDQPVRVTALSAPDLTIAGTVAGLDRGQVELRVPAPFAPGTLVKLEADETLVLGQVTEAWEGGATVAIEHVLTQVDALKRRGKAWLDGAAEKRLP